MKHPRLRVWLTATLIVLSSLAAYGQGAPTGAIAGTITDPTGAVVSGATVTIRSNETGQEFTATTADNGTFTVPALKSGTYRVTVTAQGFKQAVVESVKVDVGTPSSVTVALELGAATESITITGTGGELLQTQTATVGTTITGRQITDLPFTSRDALDLVTLLPGVQTTGRPRNSSVNGLPKGALNISIDGTNVQDNLIRSQDGFFTFVRPRIDAIEEVTVSTATPGAESSGEGAVQIKFVTRAGTNDFTGSLYWYHRNPVLNANYYFNNLLLPPDPKTGRPPRNRVLLNQYGGRVGGPITIPKLFDGRDRAFFFVNYEEFRLPEQQIRTRTIFSPQAQSGVFQYNTAGGVRSVNLLTLAAANGLTATADPTVAGTLAAIRGATATTGGITPLADPNFEGYSFIGVGGQKRYFPTVRLDFNLTDKHHLENVWNYQVFKNPVDFLNSGDPAFPGFPNTANQDSLRWTNTTALRSTLTPTIVNEARFGMLGGISMFGSGTTPAQFANQGGFDLAFSDSVAGLSDATARRLPGTFNIFGQSFFGNTANRRNTPVFQFADTLTWVRGAHSLNFGASFTQINSFQQNLNQIVPVAIFGLDPNDPANAIFTAANFPGASAAQIAQAGTIYALLTGRVTNLAGNAFLDESSKYNFLGEQVSRFRQREFGLFGQDSWRFRPNLTVNFGLRWEPQFSPVSRNRSLAKTSFADIFGVSGEGNIFKPGTLTGRPTQFTELEPDEKLYEPDWNNFAPSFGVAWSPDWREGVLNRVFGNAGQTVLRGGYSIAYIREGLSVITQPIIANPGGTLVVNRQTIDGTLAPGTLLRDLAGNFTPAPFPSAPTYPLLGNLGSAGSAYNPNIRAGYAHSWTLGIQRELNKDTVFEARYVGTRGIKLWRRHTINEVNVVENGFLNEFRQVQANLAANIAAGRGNTFAYFGAGTGTAPLPITLSFFTGLPAAAAANPVNYSNAANSPFRNATFVGPLAVNNANPVGFAGNLNTFFLQNAIAAGLPANFFIVNPGLGAAAVTDNGGRTWYDGLTLEVRRRLAAGLLVQANYTFSKSLTDMFAASQSVTSNYFTLRDPALNKSLSPFDINHAFKANWLYELPVGTGRYFLGNANGVVDRLVGGWEFHGTARVQSGRAFQLGNVQLVGITRQELEDAIEIRKVGRTVFFLPEDIVLNTRRAFNVSATSATGYSALGVPEGRYIAPPGSNGCVPAFTGACGFSNIILHGPRFVRFDLSAVKKIKITERTNLEFRAEFLNAFNNINFLVGGDAAAENPPPAVTNFNAATFGQTTFAYQDISTTNDPGGRLIQFVLRFNF